MCAFQSVFKRKLFYLIAKKILVFNTVITYSDAHINLIKQHNFIYKFDFMRTYVFMFSKYSYMFFNMLLFDKIQRKIKHEM